MTALRTWLGSFGGAGAAANARTARDARLQAFVAVDDLERRFAVARQRAA